MMADGRIHGVEEPRVRRDEQRQHTPGHDTIADVPESLFVIRHMLEDVQAEDRVHGLERGQPRGIAEIGLVHGDAFRLEALPEDVHEIGVVLQVDDLAAVGEE